jgi:hypothetical protein
VKQHDGRPRSGHDIVNLPKPRIGVTPLNCWPGVYPQWFSSARISPVVTRQRTRMIQLKLFSILLTCCDDVKP